MLHYSPEHVAPPSPSYCPGDILRLAYRDPIVNHFVQCWKHGRMTWDEMLIGLVKELVNQHERMTAPPVSIGPTGKAIVALPNLAKVSTAAADHEQLDFSGVEAAGRRAGEAHARRMERIMLEAITGRPLSMGGLFTTPPDFCSFTNGLVNAMASGLGIPPAALDAPVYASKSEGGADGYCNSCDNRLVYRDYILTCNPPLYVYKCEDCGKTFHLQEADHRALYAQVPEVQVRINLDTGIAQFTPTVENIAPPPAPNFACATCKDTGLYTGLNVVEPCPDCCDDEPDDDCDPTADD